MAPIEVFFFGFVLLFGLIGCIRGFLRELGVTIAMMFLLFVLSLLDPYMDTVLTKILGFVAPSAPSDIYRPVGAWLFGLMTIGAAFAAYQGEALTFQGNSVGVRNALLGSVVGLLNGYLIVGSVWYFLQRFAYPIAFLGLSAERLSPLAQELVAYLPGNLLGQPVLLGQNLFLYLSVLLLIARVIR